MKRQLATPGRWLMLIAGLGATAGLASHAAAASYRESPVLAGEVEAGKMPAVAERLPRRPLLLQPGDAPGRYGGVWRVATLEQNDIGFLYRCIGYEPLVRWDPLWRRIVPGVAERWEVSEDAMTYTFWLREGLRWSDGEPMTTADILFWREHVVGAPRSTAAASVWLAPGGKLPQVSAVDTRTITFKFERPNGMFLQWLATPSGAGPVTNPRHALARSFAALNPEAEMDARTAGHQTPWDWYEALWVSPYVVAVKHRVPTLNAWVVTGQGRDANGRTQTVARRNPYYWKIDPLGQQLPYLEGVICVVARDRDDLLQMALAGELDMQDHYLRGRDQLAALQEAATAGRVRLSRRVPSSSNTAAISLNLNHRNAALRDFFANRSVRIALSLAIDREGMIADILGGRGRPYQVAPRPDSAYYHERLATQHLEHDPAQAGALLDEAGFPAGADGQRRFGREGGPIQFTVQVAGDISPNAEAIARQLARDWGQLGLTVNVHSLTQGEFYELKNRNGHDVSLWSGDGGLDPLLEPRYYLPISEESNYALRWAAWFQRREAGEPPPPAILELYRLYQEAMEAGTERAQKARFNRLLDHVADEFLVIGCTLPEDDFGVVNRSLRNVPPFMYVSWNYPHPGPANPCLLYFAE